MSDDILGGIRRYNFSVRVAVTLVRRLGALQHVCSECDASLVVRIDGLAEVDGVLELLLQHVAARVTRQLE